MSCGAEGPPRASSSRSARGRDRARPSPRLVQRVRRAPLRDSEEARATFPGFAAPPWRCPPWRPGEDGRDGRSAVRSRGASRPGARRHLAASWPLSVTTSPLRSSSSADACKRSRRRANPLPAVKGPAVSTSRCYDVYSEEPPAGGSQIRKTAPYGASAIRRTFLAKPYFDSQCQSDW